VYGTDFGRMSDRHSRNSCFQSWKPSWCLCAGAMGFVENFVMRKHSHVSIQTCDCCYNITCDATALTGIINKALNLQFYITIPKSFVCEVKMFL
jgi:hypothetical protein